MSSHKHLTLFPLLLMCTLHSHANSAIITSDNSNTTIEESFDESLEENCPVNNNYCNCTGEPLTSVSCKNVSDPNILQEVVRNFTEQILILELSSLNMTVFPVESLQSPSLMSLIVKNSSFGTFRNSSELTDVNNLSNLHHLSLEQVSTSDWSWNQMSYLKKLNIFFIYNTTIGENITSSFRQYISKSLKLLSISGSNVTSIEGGSFEELKNLTYLRISHSKLSTLTRDILPTTSKLEHLRLDHNEIISLPNDMFENMPNLTVLSLSNNRISTLPEELFRPLWKPNLHIELRGNPIKCDCRLSWIVTSSYKQNINGKCASPKKLFGRKMKDLRQSDLNC